MLDGFVLLIMLVYLQIFSLLSMQALSSATVYKKFEFNQLVVFQKRRQVLDVLAFLDQKPQVSCVMTMRSHKWFLHQSSAWWRRHACHISFATNDYYYVREMLDAGTCGVTSNEYKQQVTPIYYRNTLLQVSGVSAHQSLMVQDVVVWPGQNPPVCNKTLWHVNTGRQMLRWLE